MIHPHTFLTTSRHHRTDLVDRASAVLGTRPLAHYRRAARRRAGAIHPSRRQELPQTPSRPRSPAEPRKPS